MREEVSPAGTAFGRLLRQGRTTAGHTQDEVASATGVSKRTYIRYEQGEVDLVPLQLIAAVCRFNGVNPLEAAVALNFVTPDELEATDDPLISQLRHLLAGDSMSPAVAENVRRLLAVAVRLGVTDATATPEGAHNALIRAVSAALDLYDTAETAGHPASNPQAGHAES